jgi:hypothetical protein
MPIGVFLMFLFRGRYGKEGLSAACDGAGSAIGIYVCRPAQLESQFLRS